VACLLEGSGGVNLCLQPVPSIENWILWGGKGEGEMRLRVEYQDGA
jgi:hypothetical protein